MKILLPAASIGSRRMWIHLLFYFAIGSLFASLVTGPGQLYLGRLYYIKDMGVVLCFFILAWLATVRNDKLAMLLVAAGMAIILVFAPAVLLRRDESPATAITIMWIMKWTVAAQLGILAYRERLQRALAISLAALLAIICVDALIGLWEIRTQGYFFQLSDLDETAAGVALSGREDLGGLIRIHGIHRSPGDFGNTMGMGMMVSAFLLLASRRKILRLAMAPLFLLCAYTLFFSTLRSFLVGAVAGVMALLGAMLLRRWVNRYLTPMLAVLILACLFFSYFNIIPVVEFVSRHILNNSEIGDVNSSYMRLDAWDDVFSDIRATPMVAIIGGPLASALALDAPPSNICDNVYLWLFYHLGIFGLLSFVVCIPMPLATRTDTRVRALYFAAATQVLVAGIFTDSLFYFSSLTLFLTLGLILAEWRVLPAQIFNRGTPILARPRQDAPPAFTYLPGND